jgi:hypothetical protein
MTVASALAHENAKRFLSGMELKTNKLHQERNQLKVIPAIIKCNHYPLLWSDLREIGNQCSVATTFVKMMSKTLYEEGWRPENCTVPKPIALRA